MRLFGKTLASILFVTFNVANGGTVNSWHLKWDELPPLPDTPGVAGAFIGNSGNCLLVAGGANFESPVWQSDKVWHDTVWILESTGSGSDLEWSVAGKLPRPSAYGMSVSHNGRVICMGGENGGVFSDAVFALSWERGNKILSMEKLPSLPQPCAFGQATLAGDVIYVAGGQSNRDITSAMLNFWRLNLAQASQADWSWELLPPWPGAERILPVMAAQNTGRAIGIYLFSGRCKRNGEMTFLRDAYRFIPQLYPVQNKRSPWDSIGEMPDCVAAGCAVAFGDAHVLFFGGDNGALFDQTDILRDAHPGFPRRAYAYHTITDTWVDAGETPLNQVTTVALPWNGRIVIPTGEIRPRVRTPRVTTVEVCGMQTNFGWLNYLTLGLYLTAMLGIGAWFAHKTKSTDDYFRGGQKIPWWAAGCSIFATMLSSITFMAFPAVAFKTDWTTMGMQWLIPLVSLWVVWRILPFFRRIDATSAYEYLEKRFNYPSRVIGSLLFTLFQIGRMGVVLYLPALALQAVTRIDPIVCILLMGFVSVVYSAMGGIEAVVWTDTVQTFVLLGGALLSLILIILKLDEGLATFIATASGNCKFNFVEFDFSSTSYMVPAIWVIIIGGIFQHISSYTADQSVIQRYMTTDTEKNAGRSILINGLLAVPACLIFFAVGTGLYVYYRHFPQQMDPTFKADAIFPLFIATRMPPVVAGLVVAGVFAAAQSTLSTSMNSLSTTLIIDFVKPLNLCRGDTACLRLARVLTVLLGSLGTGIAILFVITDVFDIFNMYITILGLFMGVLCGMFLLGMFSRRATSGGCLGGACISAAISLWLTFGSGWGIHGYLYPAISVTLCFTSGYLLSLLSRQRQD